MGKGDKDRDKDSKEKARLAKETAERENREKRLTARAVSQSLHDGLSGGAAAAATAAALMGAKGARSAESPPRNSTNEGSESVDAESPVTPRRRQSGRPVEQSSPDQSEEDGTDKSVAASESENEELTTNCKLTASNKLKERTRIQVDSNADFTI